MDSNFDIVPTLRMFDGVMMGKAADEIEALRKEVTALRSGVAPSTAAQGATLTDAVRMLEGYADSYDLMARMDDPNGNGTVQCRSVAYDIRNNMAGWIKKRLAAPTPAADSEVTPITYDQWSAIWDASLSITKGEWIDRVMKMLATAKPVSVDAGGMTERPKYSEPRRLNSRGYCVGCRCYGEELDPCAWAHAQNGKQTPPTESTGEPNGG